MLAFCWAHVRRRFFEIQDATPAPIAAESRIDELLPFAYVKNTHEKARKRRSYVRCQAYPHGAVTDILPYVSEVPSTIGQSEAITR